MPDIRQLRYFIAVAEELNFMRAAERLHISQPPLSVQIKALEEELGVQLFERTNRGVVMTPASHTYYVEVRAVLARLEHARILAQRSARGDAGSLAVGFVSIANFTMLPPALKLCRERYPGIELHLPNLKTNKIDIGIAPGPINEPGLSFQPLFDERLVLALPDSMKEARLKSPSMALFKHQPFVLFGRPMAPGLYDAVQDYCARAGFTPEIVQYARQMQTIISIVSTGLCISLIPSSLSQLQRPGVAYVVPKEPSPLVRMGLLYRTQDRNPAVKNFIDIATEASRPWAKRRSPVKR
jgi:DNA-binding transcriptional LysR family regulator